MEKKIKVIFIIIGIILLGTVSGWFASSYIGIRNKNISTAANKFRRLASEMISSIQNDQLNSAALLEEKTESFFDKDNSLEALIIYSEDSGYKFIYSPGRILLNSSPEEETIWNGMPEYRINIISDHVFHSYFHNADNEELVLAGIYNVYSREDLFPVILWLFSILALFLIITTVFIVISPKLIAKPSPSASSGDKYPDTEIPRDTGFSSPEERNEPMEASSRLFSPDTGLGWAELLEEKLSTELKRAASFDQDLVFAVCRSKTILDAGIKKVLGKIISDIFTFADLNFEYGRDGFGIILPNMDLDQGIKKMESFQQRLDGGKMSVTIYTAIGVSSRNGRLLGGSRMIKESAGAAEKAMAEKGSNLIGFRTDPGKYREFIASKRQ